ncbi:MAG: LLM class flavin-dependent oxidoreductase [Dehalococcoidia bacterium]
MARRGISLAYSELTEKPDLARKADQAGFDYIWNSGESIPVFGAMSLTTQRAKIGSGVVRAFAHDARSLAQHCVDLQQLSGGRFMLGLGGGTKRMNINSLGQAFEHPATRLREMIRLLRTVWATPAGEPLKFEGQYYQYSGSGMGGSRRRQVEIPPTPVYLAAVNRSMFRLAGELCDGLCGHPIASVRFINDVAWPSIDEGLQRAGRTRDSFDHHAWIITAISNDRQQAMREAKFHMARFMATRSYAIVLDSQGLESVRHEVQEAFFQHNEDLEKLIAAVPDEVAAQHAIFGTIDDVRQQAKRYEDLVSTTTFYTASFSMAPDRIRENINLMIEAFGR